MRPSTTRIYRSSQLSVLLHPRYKGTARSWSDIPSHGAFTLSGPFSPALLGTNSHWPHAHLNRKSHFGSGENGELAMRMRSGKARKTCGFMLEPLEQRQMLTATADDAAITGGLLSDPIISQPLNPAGEAM